MRSFVLALALALVALPAQAGTIDIDINDVTIVAGIAGSEVDLELSQVFDPENVVQNPDGTYSLQNGSMMSAGQNWSFDLDVDFDPDPIVGFVLGFTNNSAVTQDFVFSIAIPIAPPLGAPTILDGNTVVSFLDLGGAPGGCLTNQGNPQAATCNPGDPSGGLAGYSGTIDGADALDLLDPFIIATSPGAFIDTGTDNSGPAANASIGIVHRFTLTAGDQATFNSSFEVVPEPGTALLMGLGLFGLAWAGRR